MQVVVELIVYAFGQSTANAVHFRQIVDTGTEHTLKTAELTQQFPPPFWTESGDALER